MTTLAIGSAAPDFTVSGWSPDGRRDYRLGAERGRAVVLAFYPGDETPVCTKQMCAYSDDLEELTESGSGAVVWGISPQSYRATPAVRGQT